MFVQQMHTSRIRFITTETFLDDKAESFSRVGLLGRGTCREKYKWNTHYDSERVTHLRGMHCECNSIGAHHAVIFTKGPVRPTRIIYRS